MQGGPADAVAGIAATAIPENVDLARLWEKTRVVGYPIFPLVEQIATEEAAKRGIKRATVKDSEILERVTTALANEGARVLEDGFALRAGDIDVIYCYGFGFPRYRGGPMFYADTVGLPVVLTRVREYRARFGDYWQPAPLIERLVAQGRGFYHD